MGSIGKPDRIILAVSFVILAAVLVVGLALTRTIHLLRLTLQIVLLEGEEMNATTVTDSLGNPFFVEQGRIIGQRVLAVTPQPQLESSFIANATITNGSDTVTNAINTGTSVSTLNADGTFRGEGQGILRTQGGDIATWTNQVVGNLTPEGTIITRGVGFWNTPSTTGELAFMDGMITVFEVQIDREGNLSAREWEWR
jgi:hypothetical protein